MEGKLIDSINDKANHHRFMDMQNESISWQLGGQNDGGQDGNRPISQNYDSYSLPYDDYPVNPSVTDDDEDYSKIQLAGRSLPTGAELLFSGQQEKGCVCFIDMVDSTKIVDKISESDLSRYYSMFLNDMTTIIQNFGGMIIKNSGDALMYYFPKPIGTNNQQSLDVLRDILDCGITMIAAHDIINTKLKANELPPMNYRISADYGTVTIARSPNSQNIDLFGSVVNHSAKINSKASRNGMAIGNDLYQLIHSSLGKVLNDYYLFEIIGEFSIGTLDRYTVYSVQSNPLKNKILNPFTRTSIRVSRRNQQ
jgi:class 3 adenylate cyclase